VDVTRAHRSRRLTEFGSFVVVEGTATVAQTAFQAIVAE
jgi:hypothetical protein